MQEKENEKPVIIPKFDRCAIAVCHFTRFTQMFTKANLDT